MGTLNVSSRRRPKFCRNSGTGRILSIWVTTSLVFSRAPNLYAQLFPDISSWWSQGHFHFSIWQTAPSWSPGDAPTLARVSPSISQKPRSIFDQSTLSSVLSVDSTSEIQPKPIHFFLLYHHRYVSGFLQRPPSLLLSFSPAP